MRVATVNPTLSLAVGKNQKSDSGYVKPMLASTMPEDKSLIDYMDGDWIMEEKYNGHRCVFAVEDGEILGAWSRPNARTKTALSRLDDIPPHLIEEMKRLPDGTYDSEQCAVNGDHTDVRRKGNGKNQCLVIFDAPILLGNSTMKLPYQDRRRLLERIFVPAQESDVPFRCIRLADVFPVSVEKVKEIWARTPKGEGAIVKRLTSRYVPGWRSPDWVKVKEGGHVVVLITGFEEGKMGPCSKVLGRDKAGVQVSVKTLDNEWRREFEKNGKKYINKQYLVVSYTTRTRKGKYWNPMFDHIAGEGER